MMSIRYQVNNPIGAQAINRALPSHTVVRSFEMAAAMLTPGGSIDLMVGDDRVTVLPNMFNRIVRARARDRSGKVRTHEIRSAVFFLEELLHGAWLDNADTLIIDHTVGNIHWIDAGGHSTLIYDMGDR